MCKLKILTFIFFFASFFQLNAKDPIGQPLALDTVIQVSNASATQLYNGAKVWLAKNMRSSNNVIQLEDVANAHLIGKANCAFEVKNFTWSNLSGCIWFTLDFQARDGRFRLKIYDISHESYNKTYGGAWSEGLVYVNGMPENLRSGHGKQYKEMQKRAVPMMVDYMAWIIVSLQEEITQSTSQENDDW